MTNATLRRTLTVPEVQEIGRIERIVSGFQDKLLSPSTSPEQYLELAEKAQPLESKLNDKVLELIADCYGMTKDEAAKLPYGEYSDLYLKLLEESRGLAKNSEQQSQKPSPLEITTRQR